jgi:serine/threonine-protein kinase
VTLLSAGMRLRDRFTLVERIGAGGMSEVWRADDELLGRPVAVKALAAQLATDPALREATWREARAAAQLTHPNVTHVYDYGEVAGPGGGTVGYLVMELVTGQSLAARLAGGPLPWPEAVRVVQQVAAALAAAHRLGVVHRDVKPGNVMLTDTGVKVLDFGIAAVTGRLDTDPGRLMGTPTYTAPERLDSSAPAAPANDVYSLGVLLYEALTGRPPAVLQDWAQAAGVHRDPATVPRPLVAGLPAAVSELCAASLSPDPAQRPAAARVAAALGATPVPRYAAGAAPVPAGGAGIGGTRIDDRPAVGSRGGRRLLFAGAGAGLVGLGLVAVLLAAALRPDDPGGSGGAGGPATSSPAPAPSQQEPVPSQPPPTSSDDDDDGAAVDALDRAIRDALDTNAIDDDAFDDLNDELEDLQEARDEGRDDKVRHEAEQLRDEIDELLGDGKIDADTAAKLTGLLDPLLR